jgi:hypothetical protein
MRVAILYARRDVRFEERAAPTVTELSKSTDGTFYELCR